MSVSSNFIYGTFELESVGNGKVVHYEKQRV